MIKSLVEKYPSQIFWCIFGSVLTLELLAMMSISTSGSSWYIVAFAYLVITFHSLLLAVCFAYTITSTLIATTGANVSHGFIFRIWFGDERK